MKVLKIPGKTFLSGEYIALKGEGSFLINTLPGFEFRIHGFESEHESKYESKSKQTDSSKNLYRETLYTPEYIPDKNSPAGKFYQKHLEFFNRLVIEFIDHYQGRGGFGSSTAEFLGLYLLKNNSCYSSSFKKNYMLDFNSNTVHWTQENLENLLQEYRNCHSEDQLMTLPSGYDLLSQAQPGFNFVMNKTAPLMQSFDWCWSDYDFILAWTGTKTATHNHLKNLSEFDFSELKTIQLQVEASLREKNIFNFIEAINFWTIEQQRIHLVHENTLRVIKESTAIPEILAIKGCGALGSDILFLLFKTENQKRVSEWLTFKMNMPTQYGKSDIWRDSLYWESDDGN